MTAVQGPQGVQLVLFELTTALAGRDRQAASVRAMQAHAGREYRARSADRTVELPAPRGGDGLRPVAALEAGVPLDLDAALRAYQDGDR